MDRLSTKFSGLNMAQKRSFVDAFLHAEAAESTVSKKSLRMELARVQNREETVYQNMLKTKERAKKIIEKLREYEAQYEVVKKDKERLKNLLGAD